MKAVWKTKTWKTKTRKTKTFLILVLTAISGPFKKAQKYNKKIREIANISRAKQQISHKKERHKKPCILVRNILYIKKIEFDFDTTIRLYNDSVGRTLRGT